MKKLVTIIAVFALCIYSVSAQKVIVGGGEITLPPKVLAGCSFDKGSLSFTSTVVSESISQTLTIDTYSTALPDKSGNTPFVGGISLACSPDFEFKIISVLGSPISSAYSSTGFASVSAPAGSIVVELRMKSIAEGSYLSNFSVSSSGIVIGKVALTGTVTPITAINDVSTSEKLSVYPNPVNNIVHVSSFSEILTLNGNKVAEGTETIDVSGLNSGIYIVKTGSNTTKITKL